ncbi:MAG: serine/threonine-protein kinase [Enhygromyxa sp.]
MTQFAPQRFDVLAKLTSGDPGELYLAEDRKLQRVLTLKLLHADRNYDAGAAELLEREARLLSRIRHPNVVAVYDLGRFGAELCMTLSPIGRYDLGQWLAQGQRSSAAVLEVLREAGLGLAAAHDAGVVHGDLSPRRVRVDERGKVSLVDFDRAVDLAPEPGAWEQGGPSRGLDLDYMAPETRSSGLRDPLSDQYSFSVIAWEALTGRRPPADPGESASLREHRRDPVYRALARGLAISPTDRWPDMNELLAALAPDRARSLGVRAIARLRSSFS